MVMNGRENNDVFKARLKKKHILTQEGHQFGNIIQRIIKSQKGAFRKS